MLDHRREVEHVARLEARTPEIDLLGDDLGRRLQRHITAAHLSPFDWILNDARRADEVDLADIGVGELERAGSVGLIAVRPPRQGLALRLRVQERQHLWVVEEDVDVVAFAVVDLEHQRGSAAEAPIRREALRGFKMTEDVDGGRTAAAIGSPEGPPSGRQRQLVARKPGDPRGERACLGRVHVHFRDELLLDGRAHLGEEREHRRALHAFGVGDHRRELVRGQVRAIRRVHSCQHLGRHVRHRSNLPARIRLDRPRNIGLGD